MSSEVSTQTIRTMIQKTIKIVTVGDEDSYCLGCNDKGETYCAGGDYDDEGWCGRCDCEEAVHPGLMTCRHCQP